MLAQRLRELEQSAVVHRRKLPPPAGSTVYELTDWGRGLEAGIRALGLWAVRSPSFPHDAPVSTDSVVLALGTFFDADAAGGLDACYELRLAESSFRIRVADGGLELGRGPGDVDAIIETDPDTLAALLWYGRELDEALQAGDVAIEGDRDAVGRFLELFPQPQPA